MSSKTGRVLAVAASAQHTFSKPAQEVIVLIAGHGVEGDAHAGVTVKHRSRVAKDPTQPNLRQVHLIHGELLAELTGLGFSVQPGELGENITTQGVDLLALPTGAILHLGPTAAVKLTGLRNPCHQIDGFQRGILGAVVGRDDDGAIVRKSGVMGVVLTGGAVRPGDEVRITLPDEPHHRLAPV
jgi:MOSC domain-containing protein YiiM